MSILDRETHLVRLFEYLVGDNGVPVRFLRWPMVSVIAGALANRVYVEVPRGGVISRIYPNLYTLLIAPTGTWKSFGIVHATGLLKETQGYVKRIHLFEGSATAKGMLEQMVATRKHPRNDKMFLVQDELAADVGGREMADMYIKALTKMYYLGAYEEVTRYAGHVKLENKYDTCGYSINVLWATTPDWLSEAVPITARHGGFFPRVCSIIERDWHRPIFDPPPPPDSGDIHAYIVERLEGILLLEGRFDRTDDAYDYERQWFDNRPVPQTDIERAYFARERDWLEKFAMNNSVAEDDDLTIEVEDYVAAAKMVKDASESPEPFLRGGDFARELREKLRISTHGANRTELVKWAEQHGKLAKDIDEVILSLKAGGEIREEVIETKGRPKRQYYWVEEGQND